MNVVMVILSLVMYLLLLVVVGFVIKKLFSRASHLIPRKRIKWILGAYCGLLLCTLVLFYTLLPVSPADTETVSEEEVEQTEQAMRAIDNLLTGEGDVQLDEVQGVRRLGEWQFEHDNDELNIIVADHQSSPLPIFVKRTDKVDDEIEVMYYTTRALVYDIDFTDELKTPHVSWQQDSLYFNQPEHVEVALNQVVKEFPVNQFSREDRWDVHHGAQRTFPLKNRTAFYLRIPQHMQINDLQGDVQIVDD